MLQLRHGLVDLLLNLATHTGGAEEVAIEDAADINVQLDDAADQAAALELEESLARPSPDEEEEDDIAQPADQNDKTN